jgi:hypothetical protein
LGTPDILRRIMFVVDLPHTYLGSNIFSVPEQLVNTASLIKEIFG